MGDIRERKVVYDVRPIPSAPKIDAAEIGLTAVCPRQLELKERGVQARRVEGPHAHPIRPNQDRTNGGAPVRDLRAMDHYYDNHGIFARIRRYLDARKERKAGSE